MPPGSTEPLREMSTRDFSCGVMAATLTPSCADCLEIWDPQLPGTLRAFFASTGIATHYLLCITVKVTYQQINIIYL